MCIAHVALCVHWAWQVQAEGRPVGREAARQHAVMIDNARKTTGSSHVLVGTLNASEAHCNGCKNWHRQWVGHGCAHNLR